MERLTEKHYLGADHYMKCSENCDVDMDCIDCPSFDRLVEHLAAYEDTGLTPEEINDLESVREISPEAEYAINKHADSIIDRLDKLLAQTNDNDRLRELAEADKEGRVVVLPCRALSTETEDGRQAALERAIEHLGYLLRDHAFGCEDCKQDHRELLAFLVELRERRTEDGNQ